ncbi:MAG: Flp family type IVb pilin [Bdellovibrionota bacterium]|nr:MAG: Flp family type IVb pilin [Bdellovibrionota bacterium]
MDADQKDRSRDTTEDGASLVEYALLIALIAVVVAVAYRAWLEAVSQEFSYVSSTIDIL